MSAKLSSLLRQIFYGSIASIAASNSAQANDDVTTGDASPNNETKIEVLSKKKVDLTPKLLLRKSVGNEFIFVSHRSHRSHSSHRSHYSSSSGGTYTPRRTPSYTPRNTPQPYQSPIYTPPSTIYPSLNQNQGLKLKTDSLHLGDRTLKIGMMGTDVTELVNILIRKSYLTREGGGPATGSYTYDQLIETAVKKFQSNYGLTSDGVCGPTTIYYLKNR